jgi:hypothetical protein
MATLVITRWRENAVGFTAWDDRTKSELTKRLKRAVNAPPGALKRVVREVTREGCLPSSGLKSGR